MSINEFIKELSKLNINLTEEQLNNLEIYKNLLQEYNQKFNLTALIKDEDIYLKHFYDSLTLSKSLDLTKELKLLDIGTGAGFPGLVLKIIYPNLDITLLDSNHKKIEFLNTVISKLNLQKITCLNSRAENLDSKYIEYFDVITSRAVAHLRILSELALPYLKINGIFVAMKGNINNEVAETNSTLNKLYGSITDIKEFKLPLEFSNRSLITIKKDQPTPQKYPRSYDQIIKKPL